MFFYFALGIDGYELRCQNCNKKLKTRCTGLSKTSIFSVKLNDTSVKRSNKLYNKLDKCIIIN